MRQYQITIETKSQVLLGAGHGGLLVDVESDFDQWGFPLFSGRRLKGLLRESVEEVLEIQQKEEQEIGKITDELFGSEGRNDDVARLSFSNYRIVGSPTNEERPNIATQLSPEKIKAYFCTTVDQTAIDPNTGAAKHGSLRTYSVLKPGLKFVGQIEVHDSKSTLNEEELDELDELMVKAGLQLRRVGTRRNRGFGEVSVKIQALKQTDAMKAVSIADNEDAQVNTLEYVIKTEGPVILANMGGDPNTTFTDRYFNGSRILGMLAGAFIKSKKLGARANENEDFQKIFLSGDVVFSNAYPEGAIPAPRHLKKLKSNTYNNQTVKPKIINQFMHNTDVQLTPLGGFLKILDKDVEDIEVRTSLNFHTTRTNRSAGRSTEVDPGIFYYESILPGQEFIGKIKGPNPLLKQLKNLLDENSFFRIGRSKSTQYGAVSLKCSWTDQDQHESHADLLVLKSPLILIDENGFPSPCLGQLAKALKLKESDIEYAEARIGFAEHYSRLWASHSERIPCYQEGSVFKLKEPTSHAVPQHIGHWTNWGYGELLWLDSSKEYQWKDGPGNKNHQEDSSTLLSNPLLKQISKWWKEKDEMNEIKTLAMTKAKKPEFLTLSRSLIGRVNTMLKGIKNMTNCQEEISDWLNSINPDSKSSSQVVGSKPKKAFEELDQGGLITRTNGKLTLSIPKELQDRPERHLLYLTTFFESLRRESKAVESETSPSQYD